MSSSKGLWPEEDGDHLFDEQSGVLIVRGSPAVIYLEHIVSFLFETIKAVDLDGSHCGQAGLRPSSHGDPPCWLPWPS